MKLIKLSQNKFAQVDNWNYTQLNQFKWCAIKCKRTYYAIRYPSGSKKPIWMHREIMGTPNNLDCDHQNHNGLDNQEHNLRNCTRSQNQMNTSSQIQSKSKYKGVSFAIRKLKNTTKSYITATIFYNHKNKRLGYFKTEEEAARAYDKAAKEYFKEFANLNFK